VASALDPGTVTETSIDGCCRLGRPTGNVEQLSEWCGVGARFVDLHCTGTSDSPFGDQTAALQPVDLTHHSRGIDVECPGEIGECVLPAEEQLDEESALCLGSEHWKRITVLHSTQYMLRVAQDKRRSRESTPLNRPHLRAFCSGDHPSGV
jgi:hypothetical protein